MPVPLPQGAPPVASQTSADGAMAGATVGAAASPAVPPSPAAAKPASPIGTAANAAKPKPQTPNTAANNKDPARDRASPDGKAGAPAETRPALGVKGRGVIRLAVSPWGQVEVDGVAAGNAPPLTELTLNEGKHQITIRNADFPPFSTTVTVTPGQAVGIKHKFGL